MQNKKFVTIGKALYRYFIFFTTVAFLVTCCTMLFVSTLSKSLGVELTGENLQSAAKLTFLNVVVLSLAFTVIDGIRRKYTVQKVADKISASTKRIVKGDFDARIPTLPSFGMDENWNEIIRCFNRMSEELSGLETLRADFIANVSHEMKTPLAVLQNYTTLLKDETLTAEKHREYLVGMENGVKRLSDMITNVLKLSRLESGEILPQAKRYNLSEQLCDCLLPFERVWEEKSIDIVADIPEDMWIEGDEELLSLVWNNLLSNAFKFTPKGGRVSLKAYTKEGENVVEVTDTGIGMTPEVGGRIFEKFYQGDSSRATQGNGLGLALVKRVVDIMGGAITVHSRLGEGSTFAVSLRGV